MSSMPPGNSFSSIVFDESRLFSSATREVSTGVSLIIGAILCFEYRLQRSTVGWTSNIGPGA